MRTVLLLGDTHINSTVGLLAPNIQLDKFPTPQLNDMQRWLWDKWLDLADKLKKYRRQDPIGIYNGDIVEGDSKTRSYQIISRNPSAITTMGVQTINPIIEQTSLDFISKGTDAHVGTDGNLESSLSKEIGATFDNDTKIIVEDVHILASHFATMSNLPWGASNAANNISARVMSDYAKTGDRPPDLVIRSHVHRWADSHDNYPVRTIILPAWTFATSYIHGVHADALPEIGAAFVHCDGNKYEVEKIKYPLRRKQWTKV